MTNLVTKQLTMNSIFSGLPNNIIIKIIQIENDRKKCEKERMKRKYNEVIQELNKLSTIDIYCPSIRDMMEVPLVCGGGEGQGEFGCWVTWAVEQDLLADTVPW